MTVQELIDKLNELPEELRKTLPVWVETENEKANLTEVSAVIDDTKIWWMAAHVTLSGRY